MVGWNPVTPLLQLLGAEERGFCVCCQGNQTFSLLQSPIGDWDWLLAGEWEGLPPSHSLHRAEATVGLGSPRSGALHPPCPCTHSSFPRRLCHLVPGNLTQKSTELPSNPDASIHSFLVLKRSHLHEPRLPPPPTGLNFPSYKNEMTGIKSLDPSSSLFLSQAAQVLSSPTFHGPRLVSFRALCFIAVLEDAGQSVMLGTVICACHPNTEEAEAGG